MKGKASKFGNLGFDFAYKRYHDIYSDAYNIIKQGIKVKKVLVLVLLK